MRLKTQYEKDRRKAKIGRKGHPYRRVLGYDLINRYRRACPGDASMAVARKVYLHATKGWREQRA